MSKSPASFAQRSLKKLHFDHKEMDYYLSWVIGRQIYDGSEHAECMAVATRIIGGDPHSWQHEWRVLAAEVERFAQELQSRGDVVNARKAWLRATTYHRAPLFMLDPADEAFRPAWRKMQSCFRQAAALFNPPVESIEVAYQGQTLAGYVWKPDTSNVKRPALIVIGGIETFAEDCYFMVGHSAAQRGYNTITIDLPGQGLTPDIGLTFGAKMGPPVKAVMDYALSRADVDAEQVAVFGFSWGGHVVLKGAQFDSRITALIANPPMPDVFRAALAQQGGQNKSDPIAKLVFKQIAWRMGLKISLNPRDIARRFGKAYDYLFHGKADLRQISCPALLLAGEGEAPITLQIAQECLGQLPNPRKELHIFTAEQNGEAHCQIDNLALPNGVMYEWLNSVFNPPHATER